MDNGHTTTIAIASDPDIRTGRTFPASTSRGTRSLDFWITVPISGGPGGGVSPPVTVTPFFARGAGSSVVTWNESPWVASFAGPAVVEELDSTVVVHPGFDVEIDDVGNLLIRREHA